MVKQKGISHEEHKKKKHLDKLKKCTTCAIPYCNEKKCIHQMVPGYVVDEETKEIHRHGVQVSLGDDGQVEGSGEITYPIPCCFPHMMMMQQGIFGVRVDKDGSNPRLEGDFTTVRLIEKVSQVVADNCIMQMRNELEKEKKETNS